MNPGTAERLALLRRWAHLLDDAFRIPGTRIRFGWDPILGLIPGLGDLTTPVFSVLLLFQGLRMRIPKVVQLRMLLNVLLDMIGGAVPVIGDLFDVSMKANVRNLALIERHLAAATPSTRGDWIFVLSILLLMLLSVAIPLLLLFWIARSIGAGMI